MGRESSVLKGYGAVGKLGEGGEDESRSLVRNDDDDDGRDWGNPPTLRFSQGNIFQPSKRTSRQSSL